jgi:hypothetical protein
VTLKVSRGPSSPYLQVSSPTAPLAWDTSSATPMSPPAQLNLFSKTWPPSLKLPLP